MRELFIRGISGLFYVGLILGSVYYDRLIFTLVILIFSGLAMVEFQRLVDHKSYMPIALVILLVYNFYQSKINTPDLFYPLLSVFMAHVFLLYWLYSNKVIALGYLSRTLLTLFYIGLGCFFIIALAGNADQFQPKNIILFFVLIWINNTFAYLVGKKLGKNPLFSRVSPKKTWEGFVGGLIFTLITAFVFQYFYANQSTIHYLIIALITSVLATLGDLIQSQFKRYAQVKDSGSLIPGHGGFFDRMDSAIFVAPWFYLLLNFKEYVS
ncbi:MAG: phosphatidate cytidylyltransferase [Bacteroidetes bacterium]|nr:phosphatidate cytidylyltransferase [Bacteroidota bacterium]